MLGARLESGETGEGVSWVELGVGLEFVGGTARARPDVLLRPVEEDVPVVVEGVVEVVVVSARPLELLLLCSGMVWRMSLREAMCAAGVADTGGLLGTGGGGGLGVTGFRLMVAPAGMGGVGSRLRGGLAPDERRPRMGDSVASADSSGSVTSATECRLV